MQFIFKELKKERYYLFFSVLILSILSIFVVADLFFDNSAISHVFSFNESNLAENPYYYFNGTDYVLINTTILPINYNGYDYGVNNGHQVYFKSNLVYGDAIQYCKDGYCFTIQPTKVTYRNAYLSNDDIYSSINFSSIGYSNGSKFIWENVFGNYNLTYDYTVNSLKEELVISKPRAPASYLGDVNNITLDFDTYIKYPVGVDIYYNDSIITNNIVVDGDIEFRNSTGHVLYYLPKPYVVDSVGHTIYAQYQIVFNGKYNSNKIREIYFYVQVPFVELNSSEIVYPIRIDPTVRFASGDAVQSVSVAALSENTFALAWCDYKVDDAFFSVYYTNGTIITSEVTVDNDISSCDRTSVSVTALSSTTLVFAYMDNTDDDATFYTYYTNGTAIVGPIDVDTDIYNDWDVNSISTTALSETSFVIAWVDSQDDDATYAAYWINGTAIKTATDVDTSISDTDPAVSVSALSSQKFVIGWYDHQDYDITFAVYWVNGTVISGPIDEDTSTAGSRSVSVAAITDNIFVIGYVETGDQDAKFSVYFINGTRINGPNIADNSIGTTAASVEVSRIDSNKFVISWFDDTDDDQTVAVYYTNATLISGPIDSVNSAATSMYWQDVFSSELVSGIGFCDGNFIHAFTVNSTYASWISYFSNGTTWDGNCEAAVPQLINASVMDGITVSDYYSDNGSLNRDNNQGASSGSVIFDLLSFKRNSNQGSTIGTWLKSIFGANRNSLQGITSDSSINIRMNRVRTLSQALAFDTFVNRVLTIKKNSNQAISSNNLITDLLAFFRNSRQSITSNNYITDIVVFKRNSNQIIDEDNFVTRFLIRDRQIVQDFSSDNLVTRLFGSSRNLGQGINVCEYSFNTSGLIAWWSLDDYNTTGVFDKSGNNNFATFYDGIGVNNATTGVVNTAFIFDGKYSRNRINTISIDEPTEGTMAFWVNGQLGTTYQRAENIYPIGWQGRLSILGPGGGASERAGIITSNGTERYYNWGDQDFYIGSWVHYVVTWNTTHVSLYKNGVAIGSPKTHVGEFTTIPNSQFSLGAGWSSTYGTHSGLLDEIIIFNRSISSTEVQTIYKLDQRECGLDTNFSYKRTSNQDINEDNFVTDLLSMFRTSNQVIDENNFVTDLLKFFRNSNQVINEDDFVTRLINGFRNSNQVIDIDFLLNKIYSTFRDNAQSVSVGSSSNRLVVFIRNSLQPINIDSIVTRTTFLFRNNNQVINEGDFFTRLLLLEKYSSQEITISGNINNNRSIFRNVNDNISEDSILLRTILFLRNNNQEITLQEFITISFSKLFETINVDIMQETVFNEFATRIINFNKDLLQESIFGDVINDLLDFERDIDTEILVCDYEFNTTGLTVWYTMDEYNSTGMFDKSGLNQFGTFGGGLSTSDITSGIINNGILFDGVDDNDCYRIDVQNNTPTNYQNFTSCIWYNPKASGGYFFGQGDDYNPAYGWNFINSGGKATISIGNGVSSGLNAIGSGCSIDYNAWNFVCLVNNGTNFTQYTYRSSGLCIQTETMTNITYKPSPIDPIRIGVLSNSYAYYPLNGSVDNAMIFNRSLTGDEILSIYNLQSNERECLDTRLLDISRSSDIDITLNHLLQRLLFLDREVYQNTNLDNLVIRRLLLIRNSFNEINIDIITSRMISIFRNTYQSILIEMLNSRASSITNQISEDLNISNINDVSLNFLRSASSSLTTEQFIRLLSLIYKNVNTDFIIDDNSDLLKVLFRVIQQDMNIDSISTRLKTIIVSINDVLSFDSISSRLTLMILDIENGIQTIVTISHSITTFYTYIFVDIFQNVNINAIVDRTSFIFRDIGQIIEWLFDLFAGTETTNVPTTDTGGAIKPTGGFKLPEKVSDFFTKVNAKLILALVTIFMFILSCCYYVYDRYYLIAASKRRKTRTRIVFFIIILLLLIFVIIGGICIYYLI